MPKHEFGLMNNPPVKSKRYDTYTAAEMLLITEKYPELQQLTPLLEKANKENKYIIHFGI